MDDYWEIRRLEYLESQNEAYRRIEKSENERRERIQTLIDKNDIIGVEIESWRD